jgi:hypothetical protein
VYTKLAEGVKKATPAVADALVAVGGVAFVTAMPPAEYPVPDTSLVTEYAVVDALMVAEAKYNAALKVSAVEAARIGETPKLWVAVINSPMNEVHIDWVFAMIFP